MSAGPPYAAVAVSVDDVADFDAYTNRTRDLDVAGLRAAQLVTRAPIHKHSGLLDRNMAYALSPQRALKTLLIGKSARRIF